MTTIMVVEDNPDIQALLTEVLEPQAKVVVAGSGVQALQRFDAYPCELVILDLMLPDVTGMSVLKQIRKQSAVPVIVLTAIQDKEKTVALLNAGANDYLTKPFDIDELVARINVQLRLGQPQPATQTLEVAGIVLDPNAHTVRVNNHSLTLTKKEFLLLDILMRHPHQVFAKADLFERVWHEPYLGAENTLNVHLSNLRGKVNQFAIEQTYIVAVWGIGVRLL